MVFARSPIGVDVGFAAKAAAVATRGNSGRQSNYAGLEEQGRVDNDNTLISHTENETKA